jgi:PIN domain nuclease of toxin-antitoxin system
VKILLDTHTFLWWNLNAPQLSKLARELIGDGSHEIFFSAASAWEIAIKYAKGRLELPQLPDRYVPDRIAYYRFTPLPVQLSHALQVHTLPGIHQDPFDRLLIAQSQMENMPILSADPDIALYDMNVIW